MGKKYDVVATTGTYTDRDGNEKRRYLNIGAVIETRTGLMLKLEAVPTNWEGVAYLNEPKPREGGSSGSGPRGGAPARPRPAPATDQGGDAEFADDDIPFVTNRRAW